jgi:hypothetical protein
VLRRCPYPCPLHCQLNLLLQRCPCCNLLATHHRLCLHCPPLDAPSVHRRGRRSHYPAVRWRWCGQHMPSHTFWLMHECMVADTPRSETLKLRTAEHASQLHLPLMPPPCHLLLLLLLLLYRYVLPRLLRALMKGPRAGVGAAGVCTADRSHSPQPDDWPDLPGVSALLSGTHKHSRNASSLLLKGRGASIQGARRRRHTARVINHQSNTASKLPVKSLAS